MEKRNEERGRNIIVRKFERLILLIFGNFIIKTKSAHIKEINNYKEKLTDKQIFK